MAAYEAADVAKMNAIRDRAEQVVEDPETAEHLKAWYRQMCKRPCFHDEYLQAFNSPNTHLIDTDGKGVESITERGVVANGVEYEVDLIIFASGFDVATGFSTAKVGFEMAGRGGVAPGRLLGRRHAHIARPARPQLPQRIHRADVAGGLLRRKRAARLRRHQQDDRRHRRSRPADRQPRGRGNRRGRRSSGWPESARRRRRAGGPWTARPATTTTRASPGTTPGGVGYPKGAAAFFKLIDEWRNDGKFEGLEFQ